jgi:hypothetical protein
MPLAWNSSGGLANAATPVIDGAASSDGSFIGVSTKAITAVTSSRDVIPFPRTPKHVEF